MVVALHASVHDNLVALLPDAFSGDVDIDPIGVSPHARIYLSEFHRRTCVVHYSISEVGVEVSIVEKNVGIMEPSIEMPFE